MAAAGSTNRRFVPVAETAAAGLVVVAALSMSAGSVRAEPIPSASEWWLSDWQAQQKVWPLAQGSGVTVAVLDSGVQASLPDLRTASPSPRPAPATRPGQAGASTARQAGGNGSAVGRIALVAVAVAAVGAFTVLQVMARSRRRRPPTSRGHRSLAASDWRTLPPPYQTQSRDDEAPPGNEESHRPDWRYGYPPGYDPGPS